jgi:hypothetical protein
MNRFFIALALALFLGVVGVGFYRGWLILSSRGPDSGNNKVNVNLTLDRDKIRDDVETVTNKTPSRGDPITEPASESPTATPSR